MASERDNAYAKALLAVAAAEGDLSVVQDEIFSLARLLTDNEELSSTLSDSQVPAARRAQIVEDLLGGRVSSTTVALLSMVVINGRVRDLPAIADEFVSLSAAEGGRQVAIARSAIELTEDQRSRLAAALESSLGQPVEPTGLAWTRLM